MNPFKMSTQSQTPGEQSQQSQNPPPTTTPPVRTPLPQEKEKQAHPQTQPLQPSIFIANQTKLASQALYYPSHTSHQQPGYAMNRQMQPIQFSYPPQRHQGHQNQSFYPRYQPAIVPTFGYAPAPTTQNVGYFYAPPGPQIDMGRAGAGGVSGGAPHVGSPLATGQGGTVVQQGSIQQPSQQSQPVRPMFISFGPENKKEKKGFPDFMDPETANTCTGIYNDDHSQAALTSQIWGAELLAEFSARLKSMNDDFQLAYKNLQTMVTGECRPTKAGGSSQLVSNQPEYILNTSKTTDNPKFDSTVNSLEDSTDTCNSSSGQLSMEKIHEELFTLMSNEKKNSLDNISGWIFKNVGERASGPEFANVLMTAILEVSIEPYQNTWQFRINKFKNLQALITRYIDVNIKLLELQSLIAIQEYIYQLDHPQRVLLEAIEKQLVESILSSTTLQALLSNRDSTPFTGKSVAIIALKSFFKAIMGKDAALPFIDFEKSLDQYTLLKLHKQSKLTNSFQIQKLDC